MLQQRIGGEAALAAKVETNAPVRERIATDRNRDRVGDRKRQRQELVLVAVARKELIAVLELDRKLALALPGLQHPLPVLDVGQSQLVADPADRGQRLGPRAEAGRYGVADLIVAPQEAELGVEVVAHRQTLELQAVAVAVVVHLRAVTG